MIDVGFSVILGFAVTSTLCGFIADHSRADRILMRSGAYLIVASFLVALAKGDGTSIIHHTRNMFYSSFSEHLLWVTLGAVAAIFAQLIAEGHGQNLWIKFHPQSAPTPEVQMGQRAQISGFRRKTMPSTLVGASTNYLNEELDLRTETLIRLSYSVFEDRGALMMSRLESALCLGAGRRQKTFHKLVAGHRGRPKPKRIVHRYWRSVNGSSRMSQALFADLCKLARDTHNVDRATVERLTSVGTAMGLTAEDMGRAIKGAL